MNIIRSSLCRIKGITTLNSSAVPKLPASSCTTHLRLLSGWLLSRPVTEPQNSRCAGATLPSQAEGCGIFQQLPWHYQQVRTRKRGNEYQPKNIKRIRTHGWYKRIRTRGGIEVILRRMLKGRKSLTH